MKGLMYRYGVGNRIEDGNDQNAEEVGDGMGTGCKYRR